MGGKPNSSIENVNFKPNRPQHDHQSEGRSCFNIHTHTIPTTLLARKIPYYIINQDSKFTQLGQLNSADH